MGWKITDQVLVILSVTPFEAREDCRMLCGRPILNEFG
jgi:hypothetical protein